MIIMIIKAGSMSKWEKKRKKSKENMHALTDTGSFSTTIVLGLLDEFTGRWKVDAVLVQYPNGPPFMAPASSSFFNLTGIEPRYTYKLTSLQPRVPPLGDQFMVVNGTQPAVLTPCHSHQRFRVVSLHITCRWVSRACISSGCGCPFGGDGEGTRQPSSLRLKVLTAVVQKGHN